MLLPKPGCSSNHSAVIKFVQQSRVNLMFCLCQIAAVREEVTSLNQSVDVHIETPTVRLTLDIVYSTTAARAPSITYSAAVECTFENNPLRKSMHTACDYIISSFLAVHGLVARSSGDGFSEQIVHTLAIIRYKIRRIYYNSSIQTYLYTLIITFRYYDT